MLRVQLLLAIALLVSTSLPASIHVGPETTLMPPAWAPATVGGTSDPMIASNGSGYLVVWADYFSTFALPLDRDGTPVREHGVPLNPSAWQGHARVADIATDGTEYLVVTVTADTLRATAVDPDGKVLNQTVIESAAAEDYWFSQTTLAQVAWNGRNYLLTYWEPAHTTGSEKPMRGLLLDSRGTPSGPAFTIDVPLPVYSYSLASNGSDFLMAGVAAVGCGTPSPSGCRRAVFTTAITGDGHVVSNYTIPLTNEPRTSGRCLVFTGREYVMVWTDGVGSFVAVNEVALDVRGGPVRAATVIATGVLTSLTSAIHITATDNGAMAFVRDGGNVGLVRIDGAGIPIDRAPIRTIEAPSAFAAFNSGAVFAVWQNPSQLLYGGRIEVDHLSAGSSLATAAAGERLLAVASAGRTQLVVSATGLATVMRRLVDGIPEGEPIPLPPAAEPSLVSNGSAFLLLWTETSNPPVRVKARIIPTTGSPSDVIDLGEGNAPSGVWTGQHYLVLSTIDQVNGSQHNQQLHAVRLSAAGAVLDPEPRPVSAGPGFLTGYARVVATPRGLVALFRHGTPDVVPPTLSYDLFAARISPAGDFISAPVQITNTANSETLFSVASDPDGHILATWWQFTINSRYPDAQAHAAIIDPDRGVVRSLDIDRAAPSVVWSRNSFVVAWNYFTGTGTELRLERMDSAGDPLPDGLGPNPLMVTRETIGDPTLVAIPGGVFLVTSRRLPEESGSDALRIVGRSLWEQGRRRGVTVH